MSRCRIENGCAMRTIASYTDMSPCGWYLASTSPTTRAHFLKGPVAPIFCSNIE
jgi:hypothetical protein